MFSQGFLVVSHGRRHWFEPNGEGEQYWRPRSLWKLQPRGAARKAMAILSARIARSRFMRLLTAQPMTRRECRSRITARFAMVPPLVRGPWRRPALAGPDVTDITGPFLVGLGSMEVAIQQVRRDVEPVIAVGLVSGNCSTGSIPDPPHFEFACSFNDDPVVTQ